MGDRLDLHGQHAARPSVLERFFRIPKPLRGVVKRVEPCHNVRPRSSCNGLLHTFRLRKGLCEGAHVPDSPRSQT